MSHLDRLGGLHRLHRLHRLIDLPARIGSPRRWRRAAFGAPAGPSAGHLLIAGLAVLALVKLANRPNRSRLTAWVTTVLLLAVGALVLLLRRSARRRGW